MTINLSNSQQSIVLQAAAQLEPEKRSSYLQRVAAALQRQRRYDDAIAAAACAAALQGLLHEVE
jgi:hypothetical protein